MIFKHKHPQGSCTGSWEGSLKIMKDLAPDFLRSSRILGWFLQHPEGALKTSKDLGQDLEQDLRRSSTILEDLGKDL